MSAVPPGAKSTVACEIDHRRALDRRCGGVEAPAFVPGVVAGIVEEGDLGWDRIGDHRSRAEHLEAVEGGVRELVTDLDRDQPQALSGDWLGSAPGRGG